MNRVYTEGAASKVQKSSKFFVSLGLAVIAGFVFFTSACEPVSTKGGDVAATINGKSIMKEQVDKVLKQQGQGQETKLSPIELAQARLNILDQLIQQEVMYQKAEKEKTVPTDEDVTAAYNKQKTDSGKSAEDIDKSLQAMGETEASAKEQIKKGLAIENLMKKKMISPLFTAQTKTRS
jgi:peptidyl-prolyl cis-trans isomerase SurA